MMICWLLWYIPNENYFLLRKNEGDLNMKINLLRKLIIIILIGLIAMLGIENKTTSKSLIVENGKSIQVIPQASVLETQNMNPMTRE